MQQWTCSLEKHQNGGNHCHFALRLTGPKCWKSTKKSVISLEGIVVNFSDQYDNYHSAYRYICKEDTSFHHTTSSGNTTLNTTLSGKYILLTNQEVDKSLQGLSQSQVHQSHLNLWYLW